MLSRITADLLVFLHFAFIAFVLAGGFMVLKWGRVAWLHIPCVIWGALIEFKGWICPLTPLENSLRKSAGGMGYNEGFIDHYIVPIIYPDGLTRQMQVWIGVVVLVINIGVYALVLVKFAKWRKKGSDATSSAAL